MESMSPEAVYMTKGNIVHPGTAAEVTAAEAKARADIAAHHGTNAAATLTGGKIVRGT